LLEEVNGISKSPRDENNWQNRIPKLKIVLEIFRVNSGYQNFPVKLIRWKILVTAISI